MIRRWVGWCEDLRERVTLISEKQYQDRVYNLQVLLARAYVERTYWRAMYESEHGRLDEEE